jgi:3-oxoacyl-[acyl-carrier protein] reductase
MREKIDFGGDSVIVTGGAGGIGETTVREFAKEGANVVVADIDVDRGQAIADVVTDEFGTDIRFVETDVSNYQACRDCVAATVDMFGGLDVLVNGATSRRFPRSERFQAFVDQSTAHWQGLIDVTLCGTVNMAHCALPELIDGGGSIINISSKSRRGISNLSAGDTTENTLYATVKSGLTGFTAALANEVGQHGVRVNAVSPGTVRTDETEEMLAEAENEIVGMLPLNRVGEPEDCAYLVLFLSSDAADWITGQTMSVNGGLL